MRPFTTLRLTLPAAAWLPAAALCAVSVGCAANVAASAEATDADVASSSAAVVVVERTANAGDGHASAIARFVRMRSGAVTEDALGLVGAAVDFPALGSCSAMPSDRARFAPAVTSGATSGVASAPSRAVELLDVGAISLETHGVHTSFEARRVPDIVDLISGVVYAAQVTDPEALAAGGAYVLHAQGGMERPAEGTATLEAAIAGFSTEALAPQELENVRCAQQDAHSRAFLAASAPVELTWEAGSGADVVYVDVHGGDALASNVRCLFGDTGHAVLPSAAFAEEKAGKSAEGTISLHRLHRETFHTKDIASGEVRFDFARTISYTRR